MAEFGVASELEVEVDQRSLREARKEIEQETGDISIPVEVQQNTPSQSVSARSSKQRAMGRRLNAKRNEILRDIDGVGGELVDLAETRNWYLEEMLDSMEGGVGGGGGDDGGKLPRRSRGRDGLLGILGGTIGSLALMKMASDSSDGGLEVPNIPPLKVPDNIPALGVPAIPPVEVTKPSWSIPVQDPGEVTIKKPSWVPIPVQAPGTSPSPSPTPGVIQPEETQIPEPSPSPTPGVIKPEETAIPNPTPSPTGTGQEVGWAERITTAASVPIAMTGAAIGGATGVSDETAADVAIGATALGGAGALFGPGGAAGLGALTALTGGAAGESAGGGGGRDLGLTGPGSSSGGNRAHSSRQDRQAADVTVNQEIRLDPTSMRDLERKLEQNKRDAIEEVRRKFGL